VTAAPISTETTDRLYATLLDWILQYTNHNGVNLNAALGGRVYRQQPPADVAYPYALFAFRSPQLPADYQELKIVYSLEAMIVNRPRATQPETEGFGDLFARALRGFVASGSGFVRVTDVVTESLPPFSTPADSNVVQVRVTAKLHAFPLFVSASYT
jgi:hypothetical protein